MFNKDEYVRFGILQAIAVVILLLLGVYYVNSVFETPSIEMFGNDFSISYSRNELSTLPISDDNQSLEYSHEGATVTNAEDNLILASGTNSLRISLFETFAGTSVAFKDFEPLADWSSKDSISFFWHGAKSDQAFNLLIECKEGYLRKTIQDDWIGWKELLIPFKDMEQVDNPNLKQVKRLGFQLASGGRPTLVWHLDKVALETIGENPVIYNVRLNGQIYIKSNGKRLESVSLEAYFIDYAGAEVHAASETIPVIPIGKSLVAFNCTVFFSGLDAPPRMKKQSYMIIVRLFAQEGVKIGEIRSDIPAFPSFDS